MPIIKSAGVLHFGSELRAPQCQRRIALFAMYYNFICTHKTLRTTPAMAAGVTSRLWEIGDIVDVLEPWEAVQVDHGEAV